MINKIILYSLLFLFSINARSQSPWVNKKGSLYGQYSITYLSYGSIINDKLNSIIKADFRTTDITASLYADFSLNDNLAVIVNLPYKAVRYDNQSLSSLGDPTIKLKYQILKDIPLSGYLGYTAPLSKREGLLRTGYNQHATELGISIGKGKKKSFIYGGFGYRYRTNIPNQILVEFEYGYRFQVAKKPFYLIFHIDGALNTSNVEDTEAGQAKLFHNDGEFLSPALKFSYNAFDDFWINIGIHSAVIVRNFGAASTINFGLAYRFVK
ncbi:MAG: hypothetical protein AB8H03_19190 [Saprospiraceae bacterium]